MSSNNYTFSASVTRIIILIVDIIVSYFSFYIAFLLVKEFNLSDAMPFFSPIFLFVIIVRVIAFKIFETYSVIIRFAGITDIQKIFNAITLGSVILLFSLLFSNFSKSLGLSVIVVDYVLLIFILSSIRILMPEIHKQIFGEKQSKINVILFGAGKLGATTARIIKDDASNNYNIVAIFDDNPNIHLKFLNGIPTYNLSYFKQILENGKIENAIIAIQNISIDRKNEIVNLCLENNLKVLQVPSTSKWLNGNLEVNQIKEIKIEDLLNRSVITLDKKNLENQFHNKRIIITGGAGSIGSELVRQIIKFEPAELVVIDQAETPIVNLGLEILEEYKFLKLTPVIADITDKKRIESIFKKLKPHIVFHAAAYKHVPIMESFPIEAINVNINGTRIIADLSNKYGVSKFVMVSTDKAVNPTNVMGASKRIAEMYIQSLNEISETQFITTRFGNVLGSNGSVIPRFKNQIKKGGPVTVTHKDITRYFMTIPEASQLVLEAGTMGNGGEIFLFDMGESVKILDLAEKLIRLSGFKPYEEIDIFFSGLRPGEKIKEELLSDRENSIATHHPKITKARVQDLDYHDLSPKILNLISMINVHEDIQIVTEMKNIVPEYKSNNSIFEAIDK